MKAISTIIFTALISLTVSAQETGYQYTVHISSVNEEGSQRIEITGGEYFFNPNYIIVTKGIPVELVVRKEPGIVPHNIVIESPEAGMAIKDSISTQEHIIHFTPAKSGRYPFYCDKKLLFFKSHRGKGMEGILEVRN
jgi:plastocyanin